MLALAGEPQHITAWKTGAEGEERLGARLDQLASAGVFVLHDRRIPGTRANIDHLVVTSRGITVVDAKHYRGRPQLRVHHRWFRPRLKELYVSRRNCTKLIDSMQWQVDRVRAALDEPGLPVGAMLCFVDADWPLIGGAFAIRGVDVLWPRRAEHSLRKSGPYDTAAVEDIYQRLVIAFPPA